MAILTVSQVGKSFADVVILEDISFEVQSGDRIGLVGINGSGKSTLFKVLTGEYETDEGFVSYARDAKLGYMEQHVCKDLEKTAFQEVMEVFSDLTDMETELEQITKQLLSSSSPQETDRLILRQTALNDSFVDGGGLTCRSRARSALLGLGFNDSQIDTHVEVLSGGQKAKLQLAKMLLSGSNLMLLDEPTNHLDIDAVEWLENFLQSYTGAYIVVSHDRYFLDKITSRTFEIEYNTLRAYKGNYTNSLKLKAEDRLSRQRVYDRQMKEISRIEGIIEQQKRWNQARNYVTIASKQKQIDRIAADLDKPGHEAESIKFRFHASRRAGDEVLTAKGLSMSFDNVKLFENVNIDIRRGEKLFLIGPNGCGKTTLLKILLSQYQPTGGVFNFGTGVDLGYYEQSQMGLRDEKTVIDEIWDSYPAMSQTELRSALAVFLFKGEDVFKQVGALSGGERARILLLKLMLSKTNLLLMDEPTNHLDISSREALENTLVDYDGTLLVVSHDRYLINKLADKIYYLDSDGIRVYEGNYDVYAQSRALELANVAKETEAEKPAPNSYKMKKENEANLRKARAALTRLEKDIEANDSHLAQLEEQLSLPENSSDYEMTLSLSASLEEHHHRANELLEEWTSLSHDIEELEGWLASPEI